jgi:hypothetical protein
MAPICIAWSWRFISPGKSPASGSKRQVVRLLTAKLDIFRAEDEAVLKAGLLLAVAILGLVPCSALACACYFPWSSTLRHSKILLISPRVIAIQPPPTR